MSNILRNKSGRSTRGARQSTLPRWLCDRNYISRHFSFDIFNCGQRRLVRLVISSKDLEKEVKMNES